MAATQRRTLSIAQPLHIKQEPLSLRTLPNASLIQQQSTSVPSLISNNTGEEKLSVIHQQANGYHSSESAGNSLSGHGGKTSKIQQIVEDAASPESRRVVEMIVAQVQQLSTAEKLLLYLKLPGGRNGAGGSGLADPLRQPMNPLGTRFEIQQTITWIRTHLTEDPDISLPKQDVYDEYLAYCNSNQMKQLSTADFGKVMKQVFPRVRPRRLGTRGNSRYCYAGLCKRMRLDAPLLPDLGAHKETNQAEDNLEVAASLLIREWAQKLLGQPFNSLRDLACHLVDKMCVDGRSMAAFALLSSTSDDGSKQTSPTAGQSRARKLNDKETSRDSKRKIQQESDKPGEGSNSRPASACKRSRMKNGRNSVESPICKNEHKKRQSPPETSTSPATTPSGPTPKMPIPRLTNNSNNNKVGANYILISPSPPKQGQQQRKKYKLIQPKPDPPSNGGEEARFFAEPAPAMSDTSATAQVTIQGLDKDALDDYLQGGNSQEQEEELLLYFHQSASSPTSVPPPQPTPVVAAPEEKISQLRLLLERNLTKEPNTTQSHNTRRRVSFETSTMDPVPPSPNTRTKIFNFTPISPDAAPSTSAQHPPPSPATRNSVTSSANVSPFVSPRNTPVPRSRHNSGQQFVFPPGRNRHCSNGGVSSQKGTPQVTRPRNFPGASRASTVTQQQQFDDFTEPVPEMINSLSATNTLTELAAHQRQRHVSAGPQLHMQLSQLDPLAQEVSALLAEPPLPPILPAFRSQSVPLHQMTGHFSGAVNPNSIAPTPVPSEFADFLENENPFDQLACERLNQLFMDSDDVVLEPARHFSSRSYPNTPIPDLGGPALSGLTLTEASSRSYPSTPVVMPDPLMSHMTLNAINQGTTLGAARRNLAELLEQTPSFSTEQATFNTTDQVTFTGVNVGEHANFVQAPDQPSFLMDDFDQTELTQLVQEVEGSSQLSQEGMLE